MKIVALDGATLNPGDNPWDEVAALGNFSDFPRSSVEQIVPRAVDADIILTNKVPLSKETLNQLPNLKMVSVTATGFNVVDTQETARRGIPVCNVPVYSTETVAQFVIAALMHVIYRIDSHDSAIRAGEWQRRGDFSFSLTPLWELSNRTIGIVGLGRIGTATAKLAEAFGMNVLAYSPRPHAGDGLKSLEWVELDELFSRSHVISLHCPQTPTNAGFVNRALLSRVRPNCILVNASRGGLVNERDLAEALNDGQLAAAVLDVVSAEPIHEHNPLLTAKNCFLTPHLAWATREARLRLMKETARNCREFMAGHPVNVVNGVHSVRLHAGSSKP